MAAETTEYDVTVIGSGPGGYVAAIRAAQLGLKTALVEKDPLLGGTCLHRGCIPTKALLEAAHILDLARSAGEFGIRARDVGFDWRLVQKRKQAVVDGQARGLAFLMKKNAIRVFQGTGCLEAPRQVAITSPSGKKTILSTAHIILATGSRPRALPHIARDGTAILDSDDILALDRIPSSLLILGAGAVGMEFASIYSRFGAECTVIELLERALPIEDQEISQEIEKAFRKRKVRILTGHKAENVRREGGGVHLRAVPSGEKGAPQELSAQMLLVAVGRSPVTEGLGLERLGLPTHQGYVPVDDHLRTSAEGIFAIGDIIRIEGRHHPMLAHLASHEGMVAAETIAGVPTRPIHYDRVPSVTYCDPEVASVGLTESEARRRGHPVKTARFPVTPVARARIAGATQGFVKIVADARYDEVLGVHMIGLRATELIAEACAALNLEATSEELARTIHAHPTLSEAVGEAAHGVHGPFIHI
ncbi:MAG: dihydrolipoyl dehydrogenase [Acidobacteriota bacterium]